MTARACVTSLRELSAAREHKPFRNCPGRSLLVGAHDLEPGALVADGIAVLRFEHSAARDPVVLALLDGGAVLSYARPDGSFVHTLNTPEGLARKLSLLGIDLRGAIFVGDAARPNEVEEARVLMREYQRELAVDLCFQGFEAELAVLPGKYSPPTGALLLASAQGHTAGCIALRRIDERTCEMKRLYVRPPWRAFGLGRRLTVELLSRACALGYARMRLDTLARLGPALALYRSLDFRDIAPYTANPEPDVVYLERELV
jgi:GNAT superfamily N-acetyltransferase